MVELLGGPLDGQQAAVTDDTLRGAELILPHGIALHVYRLESRRGVSIGVYRGQVGPLD